MARKSSKTAHVMNLLAGEEAESSKEEAARENLAARQTSDSTEKNQGTYGFKSADFSSNSYFHYRHVFFSPGPGGRIDQGTVRGGRRDGRCS